MLPAFGRELRKLRLDFGEVLKDMANKLGFSSAYLSAIEVGKRNIPADLINRLAELYKLDDKTVQHLEKAKEQQAKKVNLDLSSATPRQRDVALVFARSFKELDDDIAIKIRRMIDSLQRRDK
ncbi:MAG: helix-turn-helix domain-containing protein [Holophagales bacterium]|jgi:transcriptional regulator with XRE-family HTH domain|nr:helix-turn-helix domain-containing protein [Holophagales bacterium]